MKTLKTIPGQKLVLGHRGENLATRIIFSIAPWVEVYGPGTAHLLHQRKDDAEPYPVGTVQEDTQVSWDVTDADTAIEGYGKYELRYYVGEAMVKSSVGETFTLKSLQYGSDAPDPITGWVDHVLEKESEIYEAVNETKRNSEQAVSAAGDALNFANAAGESAKNTAAAEQNAKTAEANAKASEQAAAASAEEAKKAAAEAKGIDVVAQPGQLVRVKEVDEAGKITAWEPVPWGWVEGGMVEILPETSLDLTSGGYNFPKPFGFMEGQKYTVDFDGVTYECTAVSVEVDGLSVVGIGNLVGITGVDTGEPFHAEDMPAEMIEVVGAAAMFSIYTEGRSYTVAIYTEGEVIHKLPGKFLPDGVPYVEEGEAVEVLAPISYTPSGGNNGVFLDRMLNLVVGETYIVEWNGTQYKSKATAKTEDGISAVVIENDVFIINDFTHEGRVFSNISSVDGTPFTVSIYQETEAVHKIDLRCLPDGVPYVEDFGIVEMLPECQPTYDESIGAFSAFLNDAPVSGSTCIVNWNGTEYTCVAQDLSALAPGAVALGNLMVIGMEDTGEPFAMLIAEVEGQKVSDIIPIDGTTELTLSIKGELIKINKIDPRCLPYDLLGGDILRVNLDVSSMTADKTGVEICQAVQEGKTVHLYAGDSFSPCINCILDYGAALFQMISVSTTVNNGNVSIDSIGDTQTICVKPDGSVLIKMK